MTLIPNNELKVILLSLTSGAIAGGVAKTCIAPLDRTKIHFQVQDSNFSVAEARKFLSNTYRNHGISALWRGNSATMYRIIPYAALQFCSHEYFKKILKVDTEEGMRKNKIGHFLAGSLAGLVSSLFTYPLDLARARMAVSNSDKIRLLHVFRTTIRNDGYSALYRGCLPSIFGIIPYAGVTFFTYETAKRLHHEYTDKGAPHHLERLFFGAFAGLVGQTASYPLDVVRRRMQTSATKLGMMETIFLVVRNQNPIRSMYKGLSLNWVKGPISVGVSFATFDLLNNSLMTVI